MTVPEPGAVDADPLDVAEFRRVMGRFATGVCVATTACPDGTEHAMTANSLVSVSLDPMLVLICVEKSTRFHGAVLATGLWAVSVLDETARATATWFATPGRPLEGQLDKVAHERGERTGAAILCEALAALECRTTAVHPGGDHTIVVGEVIGLATPRAGAAPLLYYQGGFRRLGREAPRP